MTTDNKRDEIQLLEQFRGQPCVYQESRLILKVRLDDFTTDDWGVTLNLTVLDVLGDRPIRRKSLSPCAAWQVLVVRATCIRAAHVSWMLITDPDLVKQAEETARSGDDPDQVLSVIRGLPFKRSRHQRGAQ